MYGISNIATPLAESDQLSAVSRQLFLGDPRRRPRGDQKADEADGGGKEDSCYGLTCFRNRDRDWGLSKKDKVKSKKFGQSECVEAGTAEGCRTLIVSKKVSRQDTKQERDCCRGIFENLGVFAPLRDPLSYFSKSAWSAFRPDLDFRLCVLFKADR